MKKITRNDKMLLGCGLCVPAAFAAAQVYWVRELFFAWLMFSLAFCVIGACLFLLMMLSESVRAAAHWVMPRLPAARPASNGGLVRSH